MSLMDKEKVESVVKHSVSSIIKDRDFEVENTYNSNWRITVGTASVMFTLFDGKPENIRRSAKRAARRLV